MSELEKKTIDENSRILLESLPTCQSDPQSRVYLTSIVFSRRGHVSREGGYVYGGWSPSFGGACGPVMVTAIAEGGVIRLVEQGECPDGEPVMLCEHY